MEKIWIVDIYYKKTKCKVTGDDFITSKHDEKKVRPALKKEIAEFKEQYAEKGRYFIIRCLSSGVLAKKTEYKLKTLFD